MAKKSKPMPAGSAAALTPRLACVGDVTAVPPARQPSNGVEGGPMNLGLPLTQYPDNVRRWGK